ncbi:MAG: hypothetical protein WAM78_12440, partial [Candidatus Sulfotelmatobacter sp.]
VAAMPVNTLRPSRLGKILGELLAVATSKQILEYLGLPDVPASELARHSLLAAIFASLCPEWT